MLALLAILAGLIVADQQITPAKVAHQLEGVIRERIPGIEQVQVTVDGPRGHRLLSGNLDRVEIHLSGFNLSAATGLDFLAPTADPKPATGSDPVNGAAKSAPNKPAPPAPAPDAAVVKSFLLVATNFHYQGTVIKSLRVETTNVVYDKAAIADRGDLRLLKSDPGTAEIEIDEAALQPLVKDRVTGVIDPGVSIKEPYVVLTGKHQVLIAAVPFELQAELAVSEPNSIDLVHPAIRTFGVPLPRPIVDRLLADVNPVFSIDPQTFRPIRIQLETVTVRSHSITARARIVVDAGK